MELQGDQYPKGVSEERVREIVKEEIEAFTQIFSTEFANTPARADGNVNARDFFQTLEIVGKKVRMTL